MVEEEEERGATEEKQDETADKMAKLGKMIAWRVDDDGHDEWCDGLVGGKQFM